MESLIRNSLIGARPFYANKSSSTSPWGANFVKTVEYSTFVKAARIFKVWKLNDFFC